MIIISSEVMVPSESANDSDPPSDPPYSQEILPAEAENLRRNQHADGDTRVD
jgi:hypothetical protein